MSIAKGLATTLPVRHRRPLLFSLPSVAFAALLALGALGCERGAADAAADSRPGLFTPRVELQLQPYLQSLQQAPFALPDPARRDLAKQVRAFYAKRGGQPVWFVEGRLRREAQELLTLLGALDEEGLEPADYRLPAITAAVEAVNDGRVEPGHAEEVEVGLTWAALLAGSHLRHGRVDPEQVGELWQVRREPVDLGAVLAEGLESGQLAETLRRLDPDHPQFVGLLQALRRYREIAARGGWPKVPTGPVLAPGERGDAERLRALARRLQAEGFLADIPPELAPATPPAAAAGGARPAGSPSPTNPGAATQLVYSPVLAEAVRRFQHTRTLDEDGRLGEETQAELNVPVQQRLQQLVLNVERWRWVPDDFGDSAVVVNVPGYTLDVEENRRIVRSMAVVVGEEGWETPAFADRIEYLVVNPYWNVPSGILEKEILPALRRNPGYLAANDMEVVRGDGDDATQVSASLLGEGARVRQRPGARNPLGQIKFMFPNDHDIYLHDTPAEHLFREPDRNASHGCIRVERPLELADYLLRGSEWAGGKLQAAIAGGRTQEVPLPRKTPVFLLYFTAAVRPGGRLELYEDIYSLDAAHARARGGTQLAAAQR
jgi:L,D-transpeptidase YcbB